MKKWFFLVTCLCWGGMAFPSVHPETHQNGEYRTNVRSSIGKSDSASEFRSLLNEGYTQVRNREYGRAALAFERALVLTDAFQPVHAALLSIRRYTGADRHEIQVHPLVKALFFLYYSCSISELVMGIVILLAAILVLLGLMIYRRWSKKFLARSILVTLVIFLVASVLSLMYHRHDVTSPERAVILEDVDLFARLGSGETPMVRLPQATAVRQLQRSGKMVRIALPGGATGWVEERAVGLVNHF